MRHVFRLTVATIQVLAFACAGERMTVPVTAATEVHIAPHDGEDSAEGENVLEPDSRDAVGWWEGRGRQNDGQEWDIRLRVDGKDGSPCAIVEYPGIPCSGHFECRDESTDVRLVGVERILKGRGECIDGCQFEVDLTTGVIDFDCRDEGITSRVRMHRVD